MVIPAFHLFARTSGSSSHTSFQVNGAGKSTMIKLLTGEMEPCEGIVWKHPNTRVAYVAQHAFHHVEQVHFETRAHWKETNRPPAYCHAH